MKRIMTVFAALTLTLFCSAGAAAASDAEEELYRLRVGEGVIDVLQGDDVVSTYNTRTTAITLSTDDDNDLIVQYNGTDYLTHNLSLGNQRRLEIDGSVGLLDLRPSLDAGTKVILPATASVTQLSVFNGNVELYGTATLISAKSARARVQVMEGASVGRVETVSKLSVVGLPHNMEKTIIEDDTRYRYRDDDKYRYVDIYFNDRLLRYNDVIYIDSSATLGQASNELNRQMEARDNYTGNRVSGTFKFSSSSSSILKEGRRTWIFTPRSDNYEEERGAINVEFD